MGKISRTFLAAVCLTAVVSICRVSAEPRNGESMRLKGFRVTPKVVYGDDDRRDLFELKDDRLLAAADSTVALFSADAVKMDAQGKLARLTTHPYGESMHLCKDEPFYEQGNGAFCSGFLVGRDLVATAGHCVESAQSCAGTKFVFGFSIRRKGDNPGVVPAGDVYGCKGIVRRQEEESGADFALIRLDRPVAGHKPMEVDREGRVQKGDDMAVIGNPSGLPTKVAGGAKVRDASPAGYFVANLDTYHGNSGSAVLNAQTGLVEGILVRGEEDYVSRGDCLVSNRCPADGCRGEDATKISVLAPDIPIGGNIMMAMNAARSQEPGNVMMSLVKIAGEGDQP